MRLHNIIDAHDEEHAEDFAQFFDGQSTTPLNLSVNQNVSESNGFDQLDYLANNCENERNASAAARLLERLQQKTGFEWITSNLRLSHF